MIIGAEITSSTTCTISAVEGATVRLGNCVMLASGNELRADDGHPIFDLGSGKRVNPVKDITIGNHVWFGRQAVPLAGADVADGSVIGFRGLVSGRVPNNCIAVGSPVRVLRRNIARERPHLSIVRPPYTPDVTYVTKGEDYWNETLDADPPVAEDPPGLVGKVLRRFGYAKMK